MVFHGEIDCTTPYVGTAADGTLLPGCEGKAKEAPLPEVPEWLQGWAVGNGCAIGG